jgi:microcystin-dependent protein
MSESYVGEIRLFSFDYAPRGWAQCNGQLMSISQNQALFSILGNTYGGDGMTMFALPNLTGRVPVHFGNNISLGNSGGEENHTLTVQELPAHSHAAMASTTAVSEISPGNNVWGSLPDMYSKLSTAAMSAKSISASGSTLPHSNMQPYTAVNFCISLMGVYPPHN